MWNSRPYLPALWVDNLTAEDLRTSPNTATAQTARNLRPGGSFLSIISSQCGTDDAPDVEQLAKLGHGSTLSAAVFREGWLRYETRRGHASRTANWQNYFRRLEPVAGSRARANDR